MGYYQDLFNKIMIVESQGFDPMTDSYSNRIGRLDAQTNASNGLVPPNGESASDTTIASQNIKPVTITPEPTLSDIYTQAGYDDPLTNVITESGELNLSGLSTAYNIALQDKSLGVDANRVIDEINKLYSNQVQDYYGKNKQVVVRPNQSLGIGDVIPKENKNIKYTFEKGRSQATGDPIYYRWEGEPGSGKYITYDNEEDYEKAMIAYERGYSADEIKDNKKTIKKD